MAAFAAAVDLGFRYLETDVRATADEVLVAFHDAALDRTTDRSGSLRGRTWAELTRTSAGGEALIRLDDLLAAFPDARLNIDPKDDAAVRPLIAILARPGIAERACVGSFSGARIRAVRAALGRRACTTLTPGEVLRLRAAAWGGRRLLEPGLRASGGDCVQVPLRAYGLPLAERRLVELAHELGWPVHVWTVDEPSEMTRLLDLGVVGLMSDRPEVLRAVLEARGAWRGA